jgi:hypothetical protein
VTFFLKDATAQTRRGPNADLSTSWEGISAAARREWRDVDVWRQRERQIIADRGDLALEAAKRLGPAGLAPLVTEFNEKSRSLGLNERIIPDGARPEEVLDLLGPQGAKRIVEMGQEAAKLDPEGWKGVDLSDDGIEARVTERRVAAEKADAEALALSPNPALNNLIGQIGAGIADPVNIALIPFGMGSGSFLRIMGREALLGAFAEGVQYPTRTKTAEELGKPAPDLLESLALGAIGGALVGGVIEAVPRALRGYRYWQALRSPKGVPGVSDVTAEVAVRKAEQAILAGENPLDAVRTELANEPPPPREPLILTPNMSATAVKPEPTALAPGPITTEPLPPEIEPPVPEGFIRMYHGGETKADGDVLPNTFTTDRRLAEQYSANGEMSYVDVPKDADELEAAAINDFRTSLTRTLDPEKWGGLKKAQPGQPATAGETAEVAAGAGRARGPLDGEPTPVAAGKGESGARPAEPYRSEQTPEGEQFLVPGTERVATGQRQKAEIEARQLQSKIGRLNQTRVEDDASGLFAPRHIDMFDDLASPEAQAFMDAEVASMRDMEGGDFSAIADDGRQLDSLQDILDEIDESDALLREFQKCRAGEDAE